MNWTSITNSFIILGDILFGLKLAWKRKYTDTAAQGLTLKALNYFVKNMEIKGGFFNLKSS